MGAKIWGQEVYIRFKLSGTAPLEVSYMIQGQGKTQKDGQILYLAISRPQNQIHPVT